MLHCNKKRLQSRTQSLYFSYVAVQQSTRPAKQQIVQQRN
jgi:hypothetical protein